MNFTTTQKYACKILGRNSEKWVFFVSLCASPVPDALEVHNSLHRKIDIILEGRLARMHRIEKDQFHKESEGLMNEPGIAVWRKLNERRSFWWHNFKRVFPKTMFLKWCAKLQENCWTDIHRFFTSYRKYNFLGLDYLRSCKNKIF